MKPARSNAAAVNPMLPLSWSSPPVDSRRSNKRGGLQRTLTEKGVTPRLLAELQKEVIELETERGTINESISQKTLLLTEEVFEVMKVLRVEAGIATSSRPVVALGEELADILFVCAAIANRIPMDLSLIWVEMVASSACEQSVYSHEAPSALDGALRLAKQVLGVLASIPPGGGIDPQHSLSESVSMNLVGVLFSVDAIASRKKIDLESALDGKLQKDQLRLWH